MNKSGVKKIEICIFSFNIILSLNCKTIKETISHLILIVYEERRLL